MDMANKNKMRGILRVLCALMCLCMVLTACQDPQPTEPTTTTTQPPEAIYTLSVKTAGGMVLDNVDYYVYDSLEKNEVLAWGQLKGEGMINFTAPRSDNYILVLDGVPAGYDVKEYYPVTGTKMDVVLTSSVITEGNVTDRTYKVGDVMTDFTITDTEGNELKLSELLKEKDAVVLNFWYINCGPCKEEFPYLQTAYELYKDKLEVIAVNAESSETAEQVAQFRQEKGYTFPMAKVDSSWKNVINNAASPTTVIIDRYGVVCLMETGKVVEEGIFEGAFNHFTSENYQQKLVDDIEELDTLEYPQGHKRNPMITSAAVESFQVTVEAGKAYYCNVMRCDGIIFKLEGNGVYVEYDNQDWTANEEGLVTFELSCASTYDAARLIFHNDTEEAQTVTVYLEQPRGTASKPFDLVFGENTVVIKQGKDMIFYTITADKTGFVMLTITGLTGGQSYDIQIDNNNTYQSVLFSENAQADDDGNMVVAIPVTAGDELRIVFLNTNENYSEITIQALVSFSENGGIGTSEEIPYTLTFKDVEGLPMAGITATFTVNGKAVVLVSDEDGVVTTKLPKGSYMVQLVFPEGFTADAAQYLLTPDNTDLEIEVRLYEEEEINYVIHLQDQNGLPVVNAIVTVDGSFVRTDENGDAAFLLPAGSYTATIVPPEGYTMQQTSIEFGVRPEVVVELQNSQSKIPYTVTVVDGNGDPYTDVVIQLHAQDGSVITLIPGENGVAMKELIGGKYTVELLFGQNSNLRYEQDGLELTAEKPGTTIVVAPKISGESAQIKPTTTTSSYQAFYVQVGSTYVELQPMGKTYFLFKPTQPGTYVFSTSKSGAQLENWQTTSQTTPNNSGLENNVFTLEVTETGKTYVVAIDAAYGVNETILKLFRVPDCVFEEFPVTPNLPELPFTAPFMPGSQKVYLDFTALNALVLGADGYYHLDTEDGPVVMIDLRGERFGISLEQMVAMGEVVGFRYDKDGYPIYKVDYTAALNAYLAVMDSAQGLYPLTDDLYAIIKGYGDLAGWWDPSSENFLFADVADGLLLQETAWMFLACRIYVDPALCEHSFGQWTLAEDGTTMTRTCSHCQTQQFHIAGEDCDMETMGEWMLNPESTAYTAVCTVCSHTHTHIIGTDCDEASCGQWVLSADGLSYERTCSVCATHYVHTVGADCAGEWIPAEDGSSFSRTCEICGHAQTHTADTDCEGHYGQWIDSGDGVTFTKTCAVCGHTVSHAAGSDCEGHYGQWTDSGDGVTFTKTCAVCGHTVSHTAGTDCDGHYGEWEDCDDGVNQQRVCQICGCVQTQPIPTTEPENGDEGAGET